MVKCRWHKTDDTHYFYDLCHLGGDTMMSRRQILRKRFIFFSFLLFPFTVFYFSPFLLVWGSIYGILCGSMVLFSIQFISSLVFGRAFCGWVCPGAGIQSSCNMIGFKKAKNGRTRYIKYIIFIPWLITIIALFLRAGGIKSIDFLFMTNNSMPMLGIEGYAIYFGIVLLFIILSYAIGTRAFCHIFCWMAPFMVIGTKIKRILNYPSLRLVAEPKACRECSICNKQCPMGLDVMQMVKSGNMANDECILCGECVDNCHFNAIEFGWRNRQLSD